MSDNSPYGSRLGVGGRHNQIKQGIFDSKKERALQMLRETDYFDKNKIVDIDKAKGNIDGGLKDENLDQSSAPTTNPAADRVRNQQSDMTALLQQYGKVPLDPALGGVAGFGLGMVLGDGKPLPALLGAGAGYLLGKSNTINLPSNKSFDASQAVEGTQPINSGEIQPVPQLQRDEVVTPSEILYKEKADISGVDPGQVSGDELAISPGFVDAATNRSNTFGQDAVTMLAQSFKTTGDQTIGTNMQPQIGGESGLESPSQVGAGNVPNPADELVTSFTKSRVPSYLARTLGGGSVV